MINWQPVPLFRRPAVARWPRGLRRASRGRFGARLSRLRNSRSVTPRALRYGRFLQFVALSRAIVVATPIYKASYTGVLKALLDTIPPGSFAEQDVLPLATAGTLAHYLALDYALRPVLTFLGARDILPNYS
jgi:hypothetical protein